MTESCSTPGGGGGGGEVVSFSNPAAHKLKTPLIMYGNEGDYRNVETCVALSAGTTAP